MPNHGGLDTLDTGTTDDEPPSTDNRLGPASNVSLSLDPWQPPAGRATGLGPVSRTVPSRSLPASQRVFGQHVNSHLSLSVDCRLVLATSQTSFSPGPGSRHADPRRARARVCRDIDGSPLFPVWSLAPGMRTTASIGTRVSRDMNTWIFAYFFSSRQAKPKAKPPTISIASSDPS